MVSVPGPNSAVSAVGCAVAYAASSANDVITSFVRSGAEDRSRLERVSSVNGLLRRGIEGVL